LDGGRCGFHDFMNLVFDRKVDAAVIFLPCVVFFVYQGRTNCLLLITAAALKKKRGLGFAWY
jgi:hypothetical protein